MRKQFSATFKARDVHELLKEEKAIARLAAGYGVQPRQLGNVQRDGLAINRKAV